MTKDECECGHEKRYHAIPESHILGTSHCTMRDCQCKEYKVKYHDAI